MSELSTRASPATAEPCLLSDDILRGADEIAQFLFGDSRERRKVYHACATGSLPHFKIGATLYARKSKIVEWIAEQEARNVTGNA